MSGLSDLVVGNLFVSFSMPRSYRWVALENLSTERLRSMLRPISDKVERRQLLALARNRNLSFVEYESDEEYHARVAEPYRSEM